MSTDVARYAVVMYIQTSMDSGDKNEKRLGLGGAFFLYNIPTPVVMYGMVKSTASCLWDVMDKSMTAMSAF